MRVSAGVHTHRVEEAGCSNSCSKCSASCCCSSLSRPWRRLACTREHSPWVIAIGYLLFGLIAGALSLWLFPDYLIRSTAGRIAYLALGPVAAGAAVAAIGLWRSKRGVPRYGIDRFAYGYLFALSFALLRHVVAE
jgi:hypothetical protein